MDFINKVKRRMRAFVRDMFLLCEQVPVSLRLAPGYEEEEVYCNGLSAGSTEGAEVVQSRVAYESWRSRV